MESKEKPERIILAALNAERRRLIPNCRDLKPGEENLKHIRGRLANYTVEECLEVVAMLAAELERGADPQWFNAVTPFRPDNFARHYARLGLKPVGPKKNYAQPSSFNGSGYGEV